MNIKLDESSFADDSQVAMREAIKDIAVGPDRGRDISRERAALVMRGILDGDIDEIQTAVFLIALRMKRESIDEFLGLFDALNASVQSATADVDDLLLLADPFDGYLRNISITPFMPAVLSACGHNAIIHGVETVGPKHGVTAHKVYKAAGIETQLNAQNVAASVADIGWGYADQSCYAPSLFALQDLRDRIVKRTALTTLERLLVPVRAKRNTHLVLGYVHKAYPAIYATVATQAGYKSVLLLKGVEGGLAPALNKPLRKFFFDGELPNDIDAEKQLVESQPIFNASSAAMATDVKERDSARSAIEQCLETGLDVLSGVKSVARDSLCLATAQILTDHESGLSLSGAVEKVQMCLDSGAAKERFNALVKSKV
jgi:anthranilate phosphoribosyltransferase